MRIILGLCLLFAALPNAYSSQGYNVSDQILLDYREAKTFKEFIDRLTVGSSLESKSYIKKIFVQNSNFEKDSEKPQISYENKTFAIHSGVNQATLSYEDNKFFINGSSLVFSKLDYASQKMRKISSLVAATKTAHFLLLPVAWAESKGVAVSKISTTLYALTEALESSHKKQVASDETKKASEGSLCAKNFTRLETSLKSAGLSAEKATCQGDKLVLVLGHDSDGNLRTLGMFKNGFEEVLSLGNRERRFGYGLDSSGTQFLASQKDEFSEERLNKYLNIVSEKDFRRYCESENNCGKYLERLRRQASQLKPAHPQNSSK